MKKARVLLAGAEDEENLALRYLAAVLERGGHSAEIVPCSRYEDIPAVLRAVSRFRPDLIGVSVAFQSLANMHFSLIAELRKAGYGGHVTVGGHFPTFEFKRILETQGGVDSVIRFEGEQAIVELAAALPGPDLSNVANLVYRASGGLKENPCVYKFQDLDALPFPVRSRKQDARLGENFATLVSSRGCWHSSCLYCCIGAFHSKKGEKFALRSPENVAGELADLYYNRNVRLFQFHDDNFMLGSKERTLERIVALKKAIEAKGISTSEIAFLIKARPDTVDEEVASALNDLGTVGVFLGIENASETGLKALIRGATLADINRAVAALEKFNIVATYNLLIFHPTATLGELEQNVRFMKEHVRLPFDFGRAEIVAGSPLERLVLGKNILAGEWPKWSYVIEDTAVDRLFRANVSLFRRRGSPYSNLMQSAIALSYQAYALKRLHPGKVAEGLVSDAHSLIGQINAFVVDKLERMLAGEGVEKLYAELSEGAKRHSDGVLELQKRMLRLQTADRVFRRFGVREALQETPAFRSLFSL